MKALLVVVFSALLCTTALAQGPWTISTPHECNQQVCNNVPLDQGGTMQFIQLNAAFGIISGGFDMFGNPGSLTGGLYNVHSTITLTAPGQITFDYATVNANDHSIHYHGSGMIQGHQHRVCPYRCTYNLVIDSAAVSAPIRVQ